MICHRLLLLLIGSMLINSSDSFGFCIVKKKAKLIQKQVLKSKIAKKKAKLIQKQVLKTKIAGAVLGGAAVGTIAAGTLAAAAISLQQQEGNEFTIYQPPLNSLNDQTIVITGGSSGLGLESAKRLALAGANIILTARTDAKGQAAAEAVRAYVESKNEIPPSIIYKVLNLDDFESIRQVDWSDVPKIDVLLNNAGIMALPKRELTGDGYERQMQSNHLGHFLLTALLAEKMTTRARIINVSSAAHEGGWTGLKFDYSGKRYGPWMAYSQSKLANIYFTRELQRRIDAIPGLEWKTSTLHPGVISNTNLGRSVYGNTNTEENISTEKKEESNIFSNVTASFGFKTVPQGASTQVWLASGVDVVGGKYYDNCQEKPLAPFCLDIEDGKRLWKDSEEIVGQTFNLESIVAVSCLMKEKEDKEEEDKEEEDSEEVLDEVILNEEDDDNSGEETTEEGND